VHLPIPQARRNGSKLTCTGILGLGYFSDTVQHRGFLVKLLI